MDWSGPIEPFAGLSDWRLHLAILSSDRRRLLVDLVEACTYMLYGALQYGCAPKVHPSTQSLSAGCRGTVYYEPWRKLEGSWGV